MSSHHPLLSNYKPSAEEFTPGMNEELNQVRLKIKAVEHCLRGDGSASPHDAIYYVGVYQIFDRELLSHQLAKLQDEKNLLLQMKLNSRGMTIID